MERIDKDPRIKLRNAALNIFKDHMWLGVGLKTFWDHEWRMQNGLVTGIKGQVKLKEASIHNSFLDLALIGGLPLVVTFILLMFYPVVKVMRYMFHANRMVRVNAAFVLSIVTSFFIYSFFHQAIVQKHNWFIFAIIYLITLTTG